MRRPDRSSIAAGRPDRRTIGGLSRRAPSGLVTIPPTPACADPAREPRSARVARMQDRGSQAFERPDPGQTAGRTRWPSNPLIAAGHPGGRTLPCSLSRAPDSLAASPLGLPAARPTQRWGPGGHPRSPSPASTPPANFPASRNSRLVSNRGRGGWGGILRVAVPRVTRPACSHGAAPPEKFTGATA
jgi:hypothetical protein